MRITIINNDKKDRSLVREELEKFVTQLADGTYQKNFASDYKKEVCFAAEWCKSGGEEKTTAINSYCSRSTTCATSRPSPSTKSWRHSNPTPCSASWVTTATRSTSSVPTTSLILTPRPPIPF